MSNQIDLAKKIATDAHEGQTRWDKKTPYITHPAAIVENLIEEGYGQEEYLVVAWLHDVIEDTTLTGDELIDMGVHVDYVAIVELLSKMPGGSYLEYIQNILKNPVARTVKRFDIMHNMSTCPEKDKKRAVYAKWELALDKLMWA